MRFYSTFSTNNIDEKAVLPYKNKFSTEILQHAKCFSA